MPKWKQYKYLNTRKRLHITEVNECEPAPCQHEGTCIDGHEEYTCSCTAGWTGTDCENGNEYSNGSAISWQSNVVYFIRFWDFVMWKSHCWINNVSCVSSTRYWWMYNRHSQLPAYMHQ